jgi:hypothetical protein
MTEAQIGQQRLLPSRQLDDGKLVNKFDRL